MTKSLIRVILNEMSHWSKQTQHTVLSVCKNIVEKQRTLVTDDFSVDSNSWIICFINRKIISY